MFHIFRMRLLGTYQPAAPAWLHLWWMIHPQNLQWGRKVSQESVRHSSHSSVSSSVKPCTISDPRVLIQPHQPFFVSVYSRMHLSLELTNQWTLNSEPAFFSLLSVLFTGYDHQLPPCSCQSPPHLSQRGVRPPRGDTLSRRKPQLMSDSFSHPPGRVQSLWWVKHLFPCTSNCFGICSVSR